MLEKMTHRGPDESGVHLGGRFWLGHTRLSIVSPSHGHQPITDHDESTYVCVNGEIYNHLDLRAEVGVLDSQRTTDSDSEIVIHGYKKFGNDICEKLLGMFAFVLISQQGEDLKVLACRDKIGIKPLYLGKSKDGREYLLSSELKGIVNECRPEDLQLVPAGHYWTPETGLIKYYNPAWDTDSFLDDALKNRIPAVPARYATVEECKAALEEAVIRRCMADVEIGLLLSGGLDSSIIGAIMHEPRVKAHLKATGTIKSFAVGQEGSPDILAARVVSKYLGTEHYEALFTPEMVFPLLEKIVYHMETYEPELIRSCIPNYLLAQKAAEHVKVVLTGEGSDELWSGYLYYGDCSDETMLQEENRRILKAVQFVNLQRADRMSMAHSLEARVPFFDVNYIATAMRVDPKEKLITSDRCEKWLLRTMYQDVLAKEVVWRTKAMQCEGVGMTWVQILQAHISELVSDADFQHAAATFPLNPPQSKEEYYYRAIFEKYYPGCEKFVHVWPGGCRAAGAPWKNDKYTRHGLVDVNVLKKGHGCAGYISA